MAWTTAVAGLAVAALAVVTGGWSIRRAGWPERILCAPAAALLLCLPDDDHHRRGPACGRGRRDLALRRASRRDARARLALTDDQRDHPVSGFSVAAIRRIISISLGQYRPRSSSSHPARRVRDVHHESAWPPWGLPWLRTSPDGLRGHRMKPGAPRGRRCADTASAWCAALRFCGRRGDQRGGKPQQLGAEPSVGALEDRDVGAGEVL